jgi:hypothetical protein
MLSAPARPAETARTSYAGLILPISMISLEIGLFFVVRPANFFPAFGLSHFLTLALILFTAGLMSGLTGFAFSAIGVLTLFLLPPITAVPLLQALSACNQMLSIGKLWKEMPKRWEEWWPQGPGRNPRWLGRRTDGSMAAQ